jgi:hypothetical protein
VLFLGKVLVSLATTFCAYLYFTTTTVQSLPLTLLFVSVLSYFIASMFMEVRKLRISR